jgi:RNA polymerase sigma-70 factor (ECF subfamily)
MSTAQQLAPPDDALVVQAVLAGDVDAYGALVSRYAAEYMRFAVRMLGTREDADEVLHTAFYRAYQHLGSCQDPTRFGAWLYRIVVNECRTRASRRGRRERRLVRDEATLAQLAASDRTDGQFALREELQRAIDCLPVDQREAFVLKYVEELSYEEMSEITGAGISALKMRTKRACDRLREILEDDRDA